jgi:hypothetical protein
MEQSKILKAVERLQGGDEGAFDELWQCFQATIKHVVFSFRDGRLNFTEADLRQEARYLLFVLAKKHDLANPFQASYLHCHVGAEIPLAEDFFLRAGLNKNALQPSVGIYGDGFGAGLGWVGPKLSLDFAMERTTVPMDVVGTHFSMTIYY